MVYMPHLPHKKPITKAMKLSLHNLFQLDSLSVFSHQCDKWDFIPAGDEIFVPSLSLHLSFTAFSLFALHPHFTLISSPPSCSLWCSFNFPMLVCFLGVFFACAPESSRRRNLLVHLSCSWSHTAENEPSQIHGSATRCVPSFAEAESRTQPDTFSPRKTNVYLQQWATKKLTRTEKWLIWTNIW